MFMRSQMTSASLLIGVSLGCVASSAAMEAEQRNYAYVEVEGTVEEFQFYRRWRAYYWREDFTMLVRDDSGKLQRIISREPTPWSGFRLGTTYGGIEVDWTRRPRVRIIGLGAIDRSPPEFYDIELDPKTTVTALIVRVRTSANSAWRDYYVNNWFHRWGPQPDLRMLPHYAKADPKYTVYGYLGGIAAPFDEAGKKLLEKHAADFSGVIYHARVVKADNRIGYELRLLHLMGRNRKTARYEVFFGDPGELVALDRRKPE